MSAEQIKAVAPPTFWERVEFRIIERCQQQAQWEFEEAMGKLRANVDGLWFEESGLADKLAESYINSRVFVLKQMAMKRLSDDAMSVALKGLAD